MGAINRNGGDDVFMSPSSSSIGGSVNLDFDVDVKKDMAVRFDGIRSILSAFVTALLYIPSFIGC